MILKYAMRRLLFLGFVVIGITALLFLITNLLPADPARAAAGPGASPEQVENLRHKLGYDQPLYIRYVKYIGNLLRGDLGISTRTREPVLKVLTRYIPASLELMIAAMLLNLLIAVPLGVLSAAKPGRLADSSSRLFAAAGMGMPLFWVGRRAR